MTSQDGHILQQHMNNRFTRAMQTARQTTGNHQRPISDDIVRRQLITNNTRCCSPTIEPFVQFAIVKNVYSGICNVKTDVTSFGGIASQRKIDVAFSSQMTETVSAKAWWKPCCSIHHGPRLIERTKHGDVEWNRSKPQIWTC
jgi:hypothetical protein